MVEIDLVSVVEGEGCDVMDKGNHFACVCPLHDDKAPSFVIYKNKPHRFICFGCNEKGDAIDFIRSLKGYTYAQTIAYLNLKHSKSTKVAFKKSMIEIIVAEEKQGVNVKEKYGDKFMESLIAKELIYEVEKGSAKL